MHARLESSIDLGAALSSVPRYRSMLCGYLNIYSSFEAELGRKVGEIAQIVSLVYQSKTPSLERDLRSLGMEPSNRIRPVDLGELPSLDSVDSVLGALYVVQGSSLGGKIIYREIQANLNIDADSGAAFFFGNGEQTGPRWKEFTTLLNQRVSNAEVAAEAASAMFRVFEDGLKSPGRTEK